MRGSFSIGKIAGIEIGINYTWIFAFFLFAWIFAVGTFQPLYPNSPLTYWVAGAVVSIAIFVSVLIHELCHSLVALSRGLKVSSIVFFIFGGVSNIEKEPETAGVEFIMAAAGPASSLVLGILFLGLAYILYLPGILFTLGFPPALNSQASPVIITLFLIGWVNILLGVFNIIPGFPLDGGRVFRSIIWGITKSLHTATVVAGNVGRVFGWAFILLGIANIFGFTLWIFQGGLLGGIWLIFIGWFLTSAADSAIREQSLQEHLAGVRVKDVMNRYPECVSPATSIETVVHGSFIQRGVKALPVCTDAGLLGIVTLPDVKRIPQDRWANTPVQEIMTRSPLQSVNENDDLSGALRLLGQDGLNQIPVMGGGQLVGLLSRADILRYLQTRQELGIRQNPRPST
jgi:Zn-dependent protease/CBS domain-containing protein